MTAKITRVRTTVSTNSRTRYHLRRPARPPTLSGCFGVSSPASGRDSSPAEAAAVRSNFSNDDLFSITKVRRDYITGPSQTQLVCSPGVHSWALHLDLSAGSGIIASHCPDQQLRQNDPSSKRSHHPGAVHRTVGGTAGATNSARARVHLPLIAGRFANQPSHPYILPPGLSYGRPPPLPAPRAAHRPSAGDHGHPGRHPCHPSHRNAPLTLGRSPAIHFTSHLA